MEEEAAATEETAGARKRKRGVSGEGEDVPAGLVAELEKVDGGYEKGLLMEVEQEDDEEGCYEGIAEEAVAEVMRWLEAEISDGLAPAPPPPSGTEAALGFVTINGNEESCGPSFSCAASTVMASVDTRAGAPPPPPVPWPFPEASAAKKKLESAGDDAEEMTVADEAWLAELLACGPLLEGFSL